MKRMRVTPNRLERYAEPRPTGHHSGHHVHKVEHNKGFDRSIRDLGSSKVRENPICEVLHDAMRMTVDRGDR